MTARAECCGQSAPTTYLPQVTNSVAYTANYASDSCQVAPTCGPSYKLEARTVYDKQEVNAYRISYDTEYEESTITVYKPVYETESRERTFTVRKPVVETSMREERTVSYKPVYETTYRDEATTSSSRFGNLGTRRNLHRPKTGLRNDDARRALPGRAARHRNMRTRTAVHRPPSRGRNERARSMLDDLRRRDDLHDALRRPRLHVAATSLRPRPDDDPPRLGSRRYVVNPATGLAAYQRGGLGWITQPGAAQPAVVNTWNSNIVPYQVPQTTYQRAPS